MITTTTEADLIQQARRILTECVIIDTETTGLENTDTIIELAAVDGMTCEVIQDALTLTKNEARQEITDLTGITQAMLDEEGCDPEDVIGDLFFTLENEHLNIAAYNLAFNSRMIRQTMAACEMTAENEPAYRQSNCIMELANRYFAEYLEWDAEQSKFRRLSLAKCLEITGIERTGNAHRALSDAIAARDLLVYIAEGNRP
ncbi:3'-5' exonuclease [Thalassolituus sp.]|uniref:3'-5' exonuclease n=1 Tax=Thalassolituus sp. TaxID=2030822 RepID=UPI0026163B02|nr:3'-5' exonuclease [Thalassolituus sp.]